MSSRLCCVADISLMASSHRLPAHLVAGGVAATLLGSTRSSTAALGHPAIKPGPDQSKVMCPCRKPRGPVQAGKPLHGHRTGGVSLQSI